MQKGKQLIYDILHNKHKTDDEWIDLEKRFKEFMKSNISNEIEFSILKTLLIERKCLFI
jgi:hypothetical protein